MPATFDHVGLDLGSHSRSTGQDAPERLTIIRRVLPSTSRYVRMGYYTGFVDAEGDSEYYSLRLTMFATRGSEAVSVALRGG